MSKFDPRDAFGRPHQQYDIATETWVPRAKNSPVNAPDFDGVTYDPERDKARLTRQLERVYEVVRHGDWHTLASIASITGAPEGSVSARLRDLRKEKFGSYDIRRKRVGNTFSYTCVGKHTDEHGQTRIKF